MPPPINTDALRQALIAQTAARTGALAYPANAMAMRVAPNQALPSGAPNTPGVPVGSPPNPAPAAPVNVSQQAGGANPAQNMAKVGTQAQSPVFDQETRDIAKALVTKLLKHI